MRNTPNKKMNVVEKISENGGKEKEGKKVKRER